MIRFVLRAFRAARIADFRTEPADARRELRTPRHLTHGERADVGTAPVEFNASRHHFHVVFVQTGGSAVFTGLHTLMAGLDAVFVFFVRHFGLFLWFYFTGRRTPEESGCRCAKHDAN
jgi:hypothetical protein